MGNGIVTINTDAAFYTIQKMGAYAFWISSDEGKFKFSGLLKQKCKTSTIAEFRCIVNAFYYLEKLKIKNLKRVILNTDSLHCIYMLENRKAEMEKYNVKTQQMCEINNKIKNLREKGYLKGIQLDFRHVKSHVSTDTPRQFVNEWCDQAAKQHLIEWKKKNTPAPAADAAAG